MDNEYPDGTPTQAQIARALSRVRTELRRGEIDETDVRLRVHEGSFWLLFGASDYDTDHRGHWGASSVRANSDKECLKSVARELLDQVAEAWALDRSAEASEETPSPA